MYYKGYYINIVFLEDAMGVPGCVHHNSDDSYTIFIGANLSFEKQQEVFEREIKHITDMDFDKKDVNDIEKGNHNMEIAMEFCTFARP